MELVVGTFTPSVLLAVARRTGRLGAHGVNVVEVSVPSSPAQFRSMLNSEIDVALTSPDNVIAYRFSPQNPLGVTAAARIVSAVDRGLGLGLYGRPGFDADQLVGASIAVDVPTSGFALAMYALLESLGVAREQYDVVSLGSTPKRLQALLDSDCDATMLNAGNDLMAEDAGAVLLARVSDVCAPYLGTVVSVVTDERVAPAQELSAALLETARDICLGSAGEVAVEEATTVLGLPDELARRYVARLNSPTEGLILDEKVDCDALTTIIELRRRFLHTVVEGRDVLADALEAQSGLVVSSGAEI